jgi:RNA polymerase sigma-70 factor (ECF subfamily)
MNNPRQEFSKIYDQYINKIYRFVFLKVNSRDTAEDLCSETFLKAWEAFKTKDLKLIKNYQAFLYQIARNVVIDYYREKGRTNIISAEFVSIEDPRPNVEEKSFLDSDLSEVKAVLANLKQNYQEVIIWRYIDDLSIKEISKLLGKSEGTARVVLHRALKSLKDNLGKRDKFEIG